MLKYPGFHTGRGEGRISPPRTDKVFESSNAKFNYLFMSSVAIVFAKPSARKGSEFFTIHGTFLTLAWS